METRNIDFFIANSIKADIPDLVFEETKTFNNINYNIFGRHNVTLAQGDSIKIKLSLATGGFLGLGDLTSNNILLILAVILGIGGVVLFVAAYRRRQSYTYVDDYEEEEGEEEYEDEEYEDEIEEDEEWEDEGEETSEKKEAVTEDLKTEEDVFSELVEYLDELFEEGCIDRKLYKSVRGELLLYIQE